MARFVDNAYPILRDDPRLPSDTRADIWDLFHIHSKDAAELAQHLQTIPGLPDDTRAQLIAAKTANPTSMEYDNVDRVVQAVERMAKIPPKSLDLAEQHKNIFQIILDNQK
jgi:hypothetical protein